MTKKLHTYAPRYEWVVLKKLSYFCLQIHTGRLALVVDGGCFKDPPKEEYPRQAIGIEYTTSKGFNSHT